MIHSFVHSLIQYQYVIPPSLSSSFPFSLPISIHRPRIHKFTHAVIRSFVRFFVGSVVRLLTHSLLVHSLVRSLILLFHSLHLLRSFVHSHIHFIHFSVSTLNVFVYVHLKEVFLHIFDFSKKPMHTNIGMTRAKAVKGKYFSASLTCDSPCLELSKKCEIPKVNIIYYIY